MSVVKRVTILTKRDCDTCHKPIEAGEIAVKKHQKSPLKNQWHHPDCWKGVK